MADSIQFLSIEDVITIHDETIVQEGGEPGILNLGMLDSAVQMPRQQFGGEYLHPDLSAMAAAYLFHLAMNHSFIDGNKRVAFLSAMVFLRENGKTIAATPEKAEALVMEVASGKMDKSQLTAWFADQMIDL